MKLRPGKHQFIYNIGNGDIRIFDVFADGQIVERVAKSGEVKHVSTEEALPYLEKMIVLAEKERKIYKTLPFLNKTSQTKLDILINIKNFLSDNWIEEEDVRWF